METSWLCGMCQTVNEATGQACAVCGTARADATSSSGQPGPEATTTPVAPSPTPAGQGAPAAWSSPPTSAPATPGQDAPGQHAPGQGVAAPDGPPPGPSRRRWLVPAAVVAAVALIGGGAYAAARAAVGDEATTVRTDDREDEAPVLDDTSDQEGDDPAPADDTDRTTTTEEAPTLTTTPPPTLAEAGRSARLWAGEAVLRDQPDLTGAELARFRDSDGLELEILDEASPTTAWYRVRVPSTDQEGYLFGAFVLDPAPGLCVAVTWDGEPADAYRDDGSTIAAQSGTKVLVVDGAQSSDRWAVVLPDGQRGWVDPGNFDDVRCR